MLETVVEIVEEIAIDRIIKTVPNPKRIWIVGTVAIGIVVVVVVAVVEAEVETVVARVEAVLIADVAIAMLHIAQQIKQQPNVIFVEFLAIWKLIAERKPRSCVCVARQPPNPPTLQS